MNRQFETYNKTRDPAIREKLIIEYLPVVKITAGRLAVRFYGHVEMDDLVSYGIFGLIDAIDKFDPNKGVKFETYASLRIRGAIIDNIRRLDWVPRTLRQENKKLERAYTELENQLGREPKEEELAVKLEITVKEVRELIGKSQLAAFVSLDEYMEQSHEHSAAVSADRKTSRDGNEPETELLRGETKDMLIQAIERLTEKERIVVTLYYYEEMTLKEISKVLSVTESRVSQIHSKAMFKLKMRLGKYFSAAGW
ncbi:MAG: FliA/WhiG family RNA polymerase sigma factor [Defluviitaleaceae bacterium]|nr:FliA/WhiG family RNA polymerase sigma factor [Defluviitaleaceae bacterium]MCL2835731.1 FliA/WhiG family RNA polymerase sigma factor [Defluviitaleaceae bacterium]